VKVASRRACLIAVTAALRLTTHTAFPKLRCEITGSCWDCLPGLFRRRRILSGCEKKWDCHAEQSEVPIST
jgi:hypothetical protein